MSDDRTTPIQPDRDRLAAENARLTSERDEAKNNLCRAVHTLGGGFCAKHSAFVRSISASEFIRAREGKCELCVEHERDRLAAENMSLRAFIESLTGLCDEGDHGNDCDCAERRADAVLSTPATDAAVRAIEARAFRAAADRAARQGATGDVVQALRDVADEIEKGGAGD
mgnify:CR=1 FL=1